ncbi:uncharacterized protein LOC136093192 [Hydra vulgaris]|uniref:uncharacterized protein LOC136093192 n=1 Tax=Hydra vulgaris TaxID=6087 RepID=UPI0032EA26D5
MLYRNQRVCLPPYHNDCFDKLNFESKYYSVYQSAQYLKNNKNAFSILNINIRSLNKNFENLKILLDEIKHDFSIICLTETWCKCYKQSTQFDLINYTSIHQPRDSYSGGGVSIFVHNSIDFFPRNDLCVNETDCESLCIELYNKTTKNIIVNAIYRKPSGNLKKFKTHLNTFLTKVNKERKHIYVVGDINLNLLKQASNKIKHFIDKLLQHNVIPTINKPTRITKKSSTLLDNKITNNFYNNYISTGIIKTDLSDHFPTFLITSNITINNNSSKFIIYRRQINKHLLKYNVDWDLIVQSVELLKKTNGNAKSTWSVIKEIIGRKNNGISIQPKKLLVDGKIIYDKSIVAENLNSFFLNIGPNLAEKIPSSSSSFDSYLKIYDKVMDESKLDINELRYALDNLKNNTSVGFDNISINVVKSVFHIIETPLYHIFNLSLQSETVPEKLKIAWVLPIFKSGDDTDSSNYRPISVLPCFSKLLERIMYNRLNNYLTVNKVLYNKQFVFKKNHSTDHALTELVTHVTNAFNDDRFTLGVFIDLSKAFDTVNHVILLKKLEHYGIKNNNLLWFKDYLSNRQQYIQYENVKTKKSIIKCGVPQS